MSRGQTDVVIARLDSARTALQEAKTIQATKKIVDIAAAAEIYAKRQELGEDAIGYAHEIKIEALAQLGQILKGMEKNKGVRGQLSGRTASGGSFVEPPEDQAPTLADLGINKKTSMVAQQLAALDEETREEIACREKTLQDVRREITRQETTERIMTKAAALPTKVYHVLYADPPWQYDYSLTKSRDIENQYPTMTLDEICALPVQAFTGDDAVLFLWATSPKLVEAFQVMKAWGFTYRTSAVWDKEKIGMGYYFRQQHEILLVGTKGDLPVPPPEARASSVFRASRGKHSAKPESVIQCISSMYQRITDMYPAFAKIELFSRGTTEPGWDAWGYEA